MVTFSLQSGSNGNTIYVEADGTAMLVDAGISGRQMARRLALHARDAATVRDVLISHEHDDHIRCAGIYQRRFGMRVWTTARTRARCPFRLEPPLLHQFDAGLRFRIGSLIVHSISTPHDAADGVAFVVEHDGVRLGILTDLGHPFNGLREVIAGLDAVYLESNYDPQMLAEGPYPPALQGRIRGPGGHLSNHEAAQLLHDAGLARLQWVAIAHLSEHNNTPQLAVDTHRHYLGRKLPIHVAGRHEPSSLLRVR